MGHAILLSSRHGFLQDVTVDLIVGMCIGVTIPRVTPDGACKWLSRSGENKG